MSAIIYQHQEYAWVFRWFVVNFMHDGAQLAVVLHLQCHLGLQGGAADSRLKALLGAAGAAGECGIAHVTEPRKHPIFTN